MNQAIRAQYKITFQNKILDFGSNGKTVYKTVNSNNSALLEFLNGWNDPQEISDLLIPDINAALSGTSSLLENGSETISIDITPDNVIFYMPNVGTDYPTVPTTDFNEIVLAWRDFLLQSPLNGTPG